MDENKKCPCGRGEIIYIWNLCHRMWCNCHGTHDYQTKKIDCKYCESIINLEKEESSERYRILWEFEECHPYLILKRVILQQDEDRLYIQNLYKQKCELLLDISNVQYDMHNRVKSKKPIIRIGNKLNKCIDAYHR